MAEEEEASSSAAALSEGELVEDETSGSPEESSSNGAEATGGGDEEISEPNAKKRRVGGQEAEKDDGGGEWHGPTARQKKKMRKKARREKKLYQKLEDKVVASLPQASLPGSQGHLSARQTDVIRSLVTMAEGEQRNRATIGKLKTIEFQSVITHLVTGSPPLCEVVRGADDFRSSHRVVVAWLSMISSDFVRNYPNHFPKLKNLSPSLMFNIEHPGSSTFVKLGLETFMMLSGNDQNPSPLAAAATESKAESEEAPSRYSYLLTQSSLSDNDYPNPAQFDVDPLGREVREYVSITDWPECEIMESPLVVAGREGQGEEMPLIAVDCEMVETERGSELARISVVGEDLECMFDTFVKPDLPVVDYRTKYSGLDESILENVTTTVKDVHEKLISIIPPNSILVGHSLENDFHAMKFRHPFVIDTSYLFTPQATPTMKPSLRKICKHLLQADIQSSEKGHDSIEDSASCMRLVQLKLEKGANCTFPFHEISPSIFTEYRTKGCTSSIVDKDSVLRTYGKGSSMSVEVNTDQEAVAKSIEIIRDSEFTFIQFHSMEYILKSDKASDGEKIAETADELDSLVIQLVENCPEKTIVFVVFGSGDIRKVRKLQQGEFTDFNQLKKQVMLARTGCAVACLVN